MLKHRNLGVACGMLGMTISFGVMAWPHVHIYNRTNVSAYGKVVYETKSCDDDNYTVEPYNKWDGPGRGICLIKDITVYFKDAQGKEHAGEDWSADGSGYARFAVDWYDHSHHILQVKRDRS